MFPDCGLVVGLVLVPGVLARRCTLHTRQEGEHGDYSCPGPEDPPAHTACCQASLTSSTAHNSPAQRRTFGGRFYRERSGQ